MEIKLSAIKRIENRAKDIPGVISLAQGIPSFASHKIIQEGAIKAIRDNKVDKYSLTAGIPELRSLIGKKLLEKGMCSYDPDTEIIVTAGAIEALSATLIALVKPQDEVIVLTPTYPSYAKIIKMVGGKTISVPLNENGGWKLNLEMLSKKITRLTRAIILCNPNNPTGSVLTQKELIAIGSLAQRNNFIIITDDVYEKFYFGLGPIFNLCSQKQFKKQTIRIVSFSKDLALSGWRIGFLHGDKKQIEKILPVHDNLVNCAPVISQYTAMIGLKNEDVIFSSYKAIYNKRRLLMGKLLKDCKDYLSFAWPQGAYYFFPKIHGIKNAEFLCFDMLEKAKVASVPGEEFGPGGEGHIRLCFGKSEGEITEGMRRLLLYFRKHFKK